MFPTRIADFSKAMDSLARDGFLPSQNLTDELSELRKVIQDGMMNLGDQNKIKSFEFDIAIASALYARIGEQGVSFDVNFWRQMNIQLIPDIVASRWDVDGTNYIEPKKRARFLATRRNYSGSLWWFVHLTRDDDGRFDAQSWKKLVARATTDTIVALVERSGDNGYPIDLYRTLSQSILKQGEDVMNRLRKIMVLNTARQLTTYPEACEDGVEGYVRWLSESLEEKNDKR